MSKSSKPEPLTSPTAVAEFFAETSASWTCPVAGPFELGDFPDIALLTQILGLLSAQILNEASKGTLTEVDAEKIDDLRLTCGRAEEVLSEALDRIVSTSLASYSQDSSLMLA